MLHIIFPPKVLEALVYNACRAHGQLDLAEVGALRGAIDSSIEQ